MAEAQRCPYVRLLRGATGRELLLEDGRCVGLRVQTEAGDEQLPADLVVGCDGRASIVRRALGLEVESQELPMDVVWAKLPRPPAYGDDTPTRFCIGRGHLFVSYVA